VQAAVLEDQGELENGSPFLRLKDQQGGSAGGDDFAHIVFAEEESNTAIAF
jgi:hypothetical protein